MLLLTSYHMNLTSLRGLPPTRTPSSISSIASNIIVSAYIENNNGDNGHPCLTPLPITPGSESPPATLTTACCLTYRPLISLLSLQSTPSSFSTCIILIQSTLLNAFSKSTKHIYTSLPCSKLLSHKTLITPIASLVPHLFLKPNWFCPINPFAFASILFVSIFNWIFEACDIRLTVLWSSHSIALDFFCIGIITTLVKSSGQTPSSYIFLHISTNSFMPFSPNAF